MTAILIIDDEQGIRTTLASILEDEKYRVFTAEDAVIGLEVLENETINLVFLDVLLPNLGGLEALERIKSRWSDLEVVMISGHANVDMAVRAVKLGAFDFLEKPLSLDKVLTVCRNALTIQKLKEENTDLRKHAVIPKDEIIGTSKGIHQVKTMIKQAAGSDARILITGENGTGKELVARAIHNGSSRAGKAFVEVNCAAIPDTLIESELFGHEKGAFTDAIATRKGRFEIASGGTLFLDEIGDMSLSAQAKVLRVLQEQTIERVGGEKTITVDVRVVAATNKDLEKECEAGRFRQDLFFRLNVIPIFMPPLRDRPEDIPMLLNHFLSELGAEKINFTPEITEFFSSYNWPGNIRELKNLAERIAVMAGSGTIGVEMIANLMQRPLGGAPEKEEKNISKSFNSELPSGIFNVGYNEAKELFEKSYLTYKFSQNGYIISKTAEDIGIYPSNLHAKLRKYGIRTER
ncbi:sigma-54-dependent transcriptional regulator [Breznakiella homolactica]|uniref:Sigma-54-dependent Fis family transcriptional regulator n=1 Tax=Breznakiella homolactica TaxID=2798577 RepID=A0A7T7XQA9_9SPIR|nr:sigma-54 dependent transcriptional regulator [Breznakiella homolactica]QQO10512.1 sigma-54 dependent transcriptional regulator [Breznakiella homolactica]